MKKMLIALCILGICLAATTSVAMAKEVNEEFDAGTSESLSHYFYAVGVGYQVEFDGHMWVWVGQSD